MSRKVRYQLGYKGVIIKECRTRFGAQILAYLYGQLWNYEIVIIKAVYL